VISATFSLEFRRFKETMLQFALMLLSANALTCNLWSTANGVKSAVTEQTCVDVAGMAMDKCMSYSFKADVAGTETVTNTGGCGNDAFCATTKQGAEAAGSAVTDWKCGTCDTDKCNDEATANGGNSGGGDEPAATSKKNFYMAHEGGNGVPAMCYDVVTTEDCTVAKLTAVDEDMAGLQMGSCPAAYGTECSMSVKSADETLKYPDNKDIEGCGKGTMTMKTKDCAGCTSMKDQLDDGQTLESGPTCSSGSALAFGLAALVASLFF